MLSRFIQTFSPDYWDETPGRIAIAFIATLMLAVTYAMTVWGWVPLLSGTTLLIHEAGHPIIGALFGERMMVYGGTLFQLLFPLVFAWHFARQSQALGYCFSLMWEASSFRNVAIYAADARSQGLPLAGNGDRIHDWNDILGRWGLLTHDQFIGGVFTAIAWVILIAVATLLVRLWFANDHP